MSSDFKAQLEKQLREKVALKTHNKMSDEAYLVKAIKFFDIYNCGYVTYEQFHQAMERIGIYYTLEEIWPIVQCYDTEGRGKIDYVDFTRVIYDNPVPKPHQRKLTQEELVMETSELLEYFKKVLTGRAGNGLITLRRIFNIVDRDRSGQVSIAEFSEIMKELKIDLSNEQINLIFKVFDLNKDGTLSYEEFMAGVRGRMSEHRLSLVNAVFDKLDPENQGYADIQFIFDSYLASKHPAVVEGRKTEEQVLAEFLDTFEVHHNLTVGTEEPRVSRNEFVLYFENVSATVGDNEYFDNLLESTWDLSGSAKRDEFDRSWTDKTKWGEQLSNVYAYQNLDPKDLKGPTIRSGLESHDNPWNTLTHYYQVATADRRSMASQYKHRIPRDHTQISGEETPAHVLNKKVVDTYMKHLETYKKPVEVPVQEATFAKQKELELALERFKSSVIQKGTRGLIGLKRQFKILDDANDGTLDVMDFQKGLDDYKVEVDVKDIETLYYAFNIYGTQRIDYVQLLQRIVGELSEFRAAKVELAWRKVNVDKAEFLDWDHISQNFNASRHPGVKAGYITADDVQLDFEETFKALHSVYHSFQLDQPVTKDEFFEYFRILSTTVPNDKVFDMIMTGVWDIDIRDLDLKTGGVRQDFDFNGTRSAWKYDFHRSLYGDLDNSPFSHPVTDVSAKVERPKTAVTAEMPAAGVYCWPYANKTTFESAFRK